MLIIFVPILEQDFLTLIYAYVFLKPKRMFYGELATGKSLLVVSLRDKSHIKSKLISYRQLRGTKTK